jgi:hypothetical protein
MSNVVIDGLGCTIQYQNPATEDGWQTVGQLKSIEAPTMEITMWESTGLGSTAVEQVPTIFKAGDLGFTVIYSPGDTTHNALTSYLRNKTYLYWMLTYSTAVNADVSNHTVNFYGYVNSFNVVGFENTTGLEATYKVAITGDVIFDD